MRAVDRKCVTSVSVPQWGNGSTSHLTEVTGDDHLVVIRTIPAVSGLGEPRGALEPGRERDMGGSYLRRASSICRRLTSAVPITASCCEWSLARIVRSAVVSPVTEDDRQGPNLRITARPPELCTLGYMVPPAHTLVVPGIRRIVLSATVPAGTGLDQPRAGL